MSILSMSKTLFKSIFRGPYTVLYPVKEKPVYTATRGRIENDISQCIFCSLCQRRCPTGAIKVDKANASWSIERLQCVQCNYCSEVCPKKCLTMKNEYTKPSTDKVRDEYTKSSTDEAGDEYTDA